MASSKKFFSAGDSILWTYKQWFDWINEPEFDGLSDSAKILYMYLFDRYKLSLSNGWVDENDKVYMIMTRTEMCRLVRKSEPTVRKCVDQLVQHGLYHEIRQGLNKPNLIYLTFPSPVSDPKNLSVQNNVDPKNLSVRSDPNDKGNKPDTDFPDRKNFWSNKNENKDQEKYNKNENKFRKTALPKAISAEPQQPSPPPPSREQKQLVCKKTSAKAKKAQRKKDCLSMIYTFTQNEELIQWLTKWLDKRFESYPTLDPDQFQVVLDDLKQYNESVEDQITAVRQSYASGYRALAYKPTNSKSKKDVNFGMDMSELSKTKDQVEILDIEY